MSWQGANIALLHASGGGGDDDPKNESVDPVSSTRYPRRDNLAEFGLPATETVEAALNRLTKSYTLAMTCVGAWHRTDSAIATAAKAAVNFETHAASSSFETTGTALEESTATLWRVGRAARQAFEIQIFKDPLISPLVPAWSTRYNLSLASFAADVASPPLLNSSCHQATVQQLAYLSLVNYADLILSGLQTMKSCNNDGILDRGLVQTLQSFQYPCFISTPGGWNSVSDGGETEHEGSNDHNATMDISTQSKESECVEETLRLAIAAYLDATAMDGSDPTVWVKLASVVRHLNRCTILHVNSVTPSKRSDDETHSSSRIQFPHRRLERYALERALTALPLHEPRNRMAERAFAEWQIEHEDKETNTYSSQINPQQSSDPIVLFLNLPRYSWTTLGRMLLRACREGSHFADGDTKRPEQQNGSLAITRVQHSRCEQSSFLINPLLCVHLSPILALPSTILTRVVSFIDRDHNWRLEATCRAMSASVISVRAAMDNASERTDRRQRRLSHCGAAKPADTRNSQPTLETATTKSSRSEATSTLLHQEELTKHNEDEDVEDRVKRVSKRVRSQILSSGKRAERKNRRSSTEYCLLGATLGCSVNDASYRNLLQQENDERGVGESFLRVGDSISPTNHRLADIDKEDSVEAWNESSLVSFVNGCRDQPCYPLSFLFRFVAHVSINVAQVFSSDSHSSLTMTTCLLDCIALMDGRTISGKDLFSSWSAAASPVPKDSGLNSFDMFAIDLLHAELRLKLCDREDFTNTDFDGDCSFVSMAVPNLVTVVNEIERHSIWGNKPSWASLKSRCYWLIANFYLWRGRSSNNIRESRTAEEEGLSWIKKTKSCLRDNCPILTPHLGSPRRKQSVWKAITIESLTTFVFEVQAASVVVLAQEQFLKVTSKYTSFEAKVPLDQTDLGIFSSIGESLLERYTGDCEANFTELIDDFIATHGKQLYEKTSRNQKVDLSTDDSFRHWFDVLFPNVILETGADVVSLSNPCILTILVSCLRTKEENWSRIINLFVQFTLALFDRTNLLLVNLKLSTDRNATADSVSSSDSDDSQIDVVDNPQGHKKMERNADTVRLQQCTTLIPLLLTTILKVCKNGIPDDDKWNLAQSSDFIALLNSSLSFVANWFQNSQFMESDIGSQGADRDIYVAAQAIFRVVSPPTHSEETPQNGAVQRHVSKLFKIIISQQHALSMLSNDNGRNERLRQTRQQADLIAHVCCDLGVLLSQFPVHVVNGTMKRSIVFGDLTSKSPHLTHFAMFCDSLLWLWKGATGADGVSHMTSEKVCLERARSCPTFDAFSRERLRVPVATVIVGLCGSAASTSRLLDEKSNIEEQMTITEICDSDESVTEWLFGEDSTCDGKCEELLRVITHVVHCVNQVFGKIDEKEACSFAHVENYVTACGPCLPLVVARVVNQFASHLLLDCGDGKEGMPSSLWSDYTFGCRTVGHLLDAVLYKAYKCLHGFTLTCDVKESATLTANSGFSKGMPQFIPESKEAAAMLYRCITRAYSQGRRSPPKAALDAVSAALPAVKRSEKSKIIRTFLFSVDARNVTAEKLATVATQHTNDDANFSFVLDFDASRSDNSSCEECEDTIVRRGLVKLIAQGPLPRVQDSTNENEWRTCAQQAEEDLSTKFFAVLDHLCFGDVNDNECWFKGYQCLSMKADLIADRLGLSAGFARTPQFYATDRSRRARSTLDINDLEYFHEHEAMRSEQGWLRCLGNDLSVFVRYCWSSFSSLRLCSAEIGRLIDLSERGNDTEHNSKTKASAWKAIQSFLTTKDFVRWQEAWGGIFVASLRIAAYRCLSLSLLASYMKEDATPTDILFRSEVTEALGVSLYSEMMGSQSYGYPMSEMTTLRKRSLCMAAKSCFQYAMKLVDLDDQESNGRVTWDLCFMVGKCQEKIAKTYEREKFSASESMHQIRKYEENLQLALSSYAMSFKQATELEDDGLKVEQNGGSAHGAMEAFYRLHASRLKCLISAVDCNENERGHAETEALRLTECFWHSPPGDEILLPATKTRERVWRVLEDVVGALAKCSLDFSFFHRSVYRHAQALMWSPIIFDPVGGRACGSLVAVSATWACKIRGLNYATNAASSALSTMSALFSKKRPQLVAVWITGDGTASAFQAINNSVRKYDSLRGKYISAYIQCLRLCRRRKELDTFLSWTASICPRDLPSFFAASARNEGGKPKQTHMFDSLVIHGRTISSFHFLTSVRREANCSLASVILQDLKDITVKESSIAYAEKIKYLETQLKIAYVCFLRLNCGPDELIKISRLWKYHNKFGVKDVVDALTTAFVNLVKDVIRSGATSDWSGESEISSILKAAVHKCRELYPSISSSFSFSRQRASSKQKGGSGDLTAGSKRKRANGEFEKSYEAHVPEGLTEGETFVTSVKVGEYTKKLRLTVPSGSAGSLRFTLPPNL